MTISAELGNVYNYSHVMFPMICVCRLFLIYQLLPNLWETITILFPTLVLKLVFLSNSLACDFPENSLVWHYN